MSDIKDGGNAFPVPDPFLLNPKHESDMQRIASGMSLRDYFAAKAMQGMLANCTDYSPKTDAEMAYAVADAMLAAR